MYVNDSLEASERKFFNFASSVDRLVVGAGAFSADSDVFSFGVISNILVESFTNSSHQLFKYSGNTNANSMLIPSSGNVVVNNSIFLSNEVLVNNGILNINWTKPEIFKICLTRYVLNDQVNFNAGHGLA